MYKAIFLWVSVVSGFIAAVLWFCATKVTVQHKERVANGMAEAAIVETVAGQQIDVLYTAKRQTEWNTWAAFFTAVSVLGQAVSLLL